MTNFDFLANLNVEAAAKELTNAPQWDAFTTRQSLVGSPHVDTKCIPLRGALSFLRSYEPKVQRRATGWSRMLPHTTALVNSALAGLPVKTVGNVLAVMLMPGGYIRPHIDEGAYPEHFDRFHIAVTSAERNWFKVGDEYAFPKPGDLFFFNHRLTHSVGNPTEEPRIHIIVDVTLKE